MSFDRFLGVLSRAFCKHKSKIGFKRPFGSISGRFRKGLGDLGSILAGFWERFGSNSGGGGRCLREAVSIFKQISGSCVGIVRGSCGGHAGIVRGLCRGHLGSWINRLCNSKVFSISTTCSIPTIQNLV